MIHDKSTDSIETIGKESSQSDVMKDLDLNQIEKLKELA